MNHALLWREYIEAFECAIRARTRVHSHREALLPEIAKSLTQPGLECSAALDFLRQSAPDSAVALVPSLVNLALSVHGFTAETRELLAALPRDKVVDAVTAAERELRVNKDYEALSCLVHLWSRLGYREKALALAEWAAGDTDEDIRDAGESLVRWLEHPMTVPDSGVGERA